MFRPTWGEYVMKSIRNGMLAVLLALAPTQAFAWGAVVSSPDGGYGWAVGRPSERAALRDARAECGGGCPRFVTFQNACGSIAHAPDGAWGWQIAGSRQAAERGAVNACRNYGGRGCRVIVWGCDFD
jgi:hypothetical protein